MKRKKGILLIIVLLLSTVLFLFAASYISSVSENAAVVSVCSEREAASIAANAGLDDASNALSDALTKMDFETLLKSPPSSLILKKGWTKFSDSRTANLQNEYRYSIDLEKKLIHVQGRAQISGKKDKYVTKQLRSIFLPEYLGLASKRIKVPSSSSDSFAGVKSIYSYITQLPFEAWLETGANITPKNPENSNDLNGLYYSGTVKYIKNDGKLWGNDDPITPFLYYDEDNNLTDATFLLDRYNAIDVVDNMTKNLGFSFYSPALNELENNSFSCYEMVKKDIEPEIYGADVVNVSKNGMDMTTNFNLSNYGFHVAKLDDIVKPTSLLSLLYAGHGGWGHPFPGDHHGRGHHDGYHDDDDDDEDHKAEKLEEQIKGNTEDDGTPTYDQGIRNDYEVEFLNGLQVDDETENGSIFKHESTAENRNVYFYDNKRICIVMPFNKILILNGDLYLNNSIIYITGNLWVKGSIRGNGVIVSANSIALYPSNVEYDIKNTNKSVNALEPSDRLLIYADNNVYICSDTSKLGTSINVKDSFMNVGVPYYERVRKLETQSEVPGKADNDVQIVEGGSENSNGTEGYDGPTTGSDTGIHEAK